MTTPIKSLGEIALRVDDLDLMQNFYENIIGLTLLRRFEEPRATFFKIADGHEGHTQILALFDRTDRPNYSGLDPARTTLDHLAFAISRHDFESEKRRLEEHGLDVTTAEHAWVRWRSLYVRDPEGNVVELVCYDDQAT